MTDARRETIERWVADYCNSTAFLDEPSGVRECAPEVLVAFLGAACASRAVLPADLEEPDMKPGLLGGVAALQLPRSVQEGVPALCANFLTAMQDEGRLAGGRRLGLVLRVLREPYLDEASGVAKPIVNPTQKVGRNSPCPCGSGRKYKKCCQGGFD